MVNLSQTPNQTPSSFRNNNKNNNNNNNNSRPWNPRHTTTRTPEKQKDSQVNVSFNSFLQNLIVKLGPNQSSQLIKLQEKLPTYFSIKGYTHCPKCITNMTPKLETDFIEATPKFLNYVLVDINGFAFTDFAREQA